MGFIRARNVKDKETRVNEIVEAGTQLYDEKKYAGITFEGIAQKINATRPLIYSYFSSKEEIMVEILRRDVSSWTKDIKKNIKPKEEKYTIDEIAEKWTDCILKHPRMIELYSMMHTVLGNNIAPEKLEKARKSISDDHEAVVKQLSKVIPELNHDSSSFFFDAQLSLAIGMYPAYASTKDTNDGIKTYADNYGKSIKLLLKQLRTESGE